MHYTFLIDVSCFILSCSSVGQTERGLGNCDVIFEQRFGLSIDQILERV